MLRGLTEAEAQWCHGAWMPGWPACMYIRRTDNVMVHMVMPVELQSAMLCTILRSTYPNLNHNHNLIPLASESEQPCENASCAVRQGGMFRIYSGGLGVCTVRRSMVESTEPDLSSGVYRQ